jgi:hypothetical protein
LRLLPVVVHLGLTLGPMKRSVLVPAMSIHCHHRMYCFSWYGYYHQQHHHCHCSDQHQHHYQEEGQEEEDHQVGSV